MYYWVIIEVFVRPFYKQSILNLFQESLFKRLHLEKNMKKQQMPFYKEDAKNLSDTCFASEASSSDYFREIFGRAERNSQIRRNPSFHLDYHIVRIGTQSMKGTKTKKESYIASIVSPPEVNKEDDHNEFNQPQTYKLALEFEISDQCQNCHYIPTPQKIWTVRLEDNRQVKLCLSCLMLLTKISMSKQQEVPFNNQQEPWLSTRKKRSHQQINKKRRSPNTKCIRFPPDQINEILFFSPPQHSQQTEFGYDAEEYPDYEDEKSQNQTSYLQKLKNIPSMIIILLLGMYHQIFKGW